MSSILVGRVTGPLAPFAPRFHEELVGGFLSSRVDHVAAGGSQAVTGTRRINQRTCQMDH